MPSVVRTCMSTGRTWFQVVSHLKYGRSSVCSSMRTFLGGPNAAVEPVPLFFCSLCHCQYVLTAPLMPVLSTVFMHTFISTRVIAHVVSALNFKMNSLFYTLGCCCAIISILNHLFYLSLHYCQIGIFDSLASKYDVRFLLRHSEMMNVLQISIIACYLASGEL